MEIKYILELDIPDEVMETFKVAKLKFDDLLWQRIEPALGPLLKGKGAAIIYRAEEGQKKIDLYKVCPVCTHPWAFHFERIDTKMVPMSDGTMGQKQSLAEPTPCKCSVEKCECVEAMK